MGGQCVASLPLPVWFPAAAALAIAVISGIIIFIAYCIRERRLRKTYYGITDEMEEEEKQQEEADALGKFDGEVKVIQSIEPIDPHSIAPTPGSQVKVIMKRRQRPAGSTKPPATSREQCCYSTTAVTPAISPELEREFKYTIECNVKGLAEQVIEPLKFMIVREFYGRGIRKEKQLVSDEEIKMGEYIVSEMRAKLEGLTNNNPWICHGRLMNSTNWVVNGHENLLGAHSELALAVKITIEQPISIVLIGYSLKHFGSSGSSLTPVYPRITSKDKLHSSALLDSTLHTTDPITPSKRSKASLLKKCKTAEPINNPNRTPVTRIVTVAPTTPAPDALILSPGRPGITAIPKTSETKKPPLPATTVVNPTGQTPKPPPTPRRTPPNQTPAQTPTPAATQAPNTTAATTSTPAAQRMTVAAAATPKAHTPVLGKTATGVSPTPPLTTNTTATTQIQTPAITGATKTPSGPVAATKHGKKTRSDDTQLSGK